MSSDLRSLYQEFILDHYKNPRNYRKMDDADRVVEGYNPLCGDHYTVYVKFDNEVVKEITFQGSGCAISKASASVMTAFLKGKTKSEVALWFEKFHDLVTGKIHGEDEEFGKLAAFAGVSEFPARVKCASLAWHSMKSAIESREERVTTE
ncbi:MAG: SUF system NifU family Fe-S cluster assembly protein [Bacteroidota bacterium]